MTTNSMKLEFLGLSENERFARAAVCAFLTHQNPTLDELEDVKTAVSEAVTNAIVHGYPDSVGIIHIACTLQDNRVTISVTDFGCGIENIPLARTPLYTGTTDGERSGLGFTVMETFMDHISVKSAPGEGTVVTMEKNIGVAEGLPECV